MNDLKETIGKWNLNNPSFLMFIDYENSSPRNYLRIKVKKDNKIVLELTGYEGEEYLWIDIIKRIKIFL